jgi:hypothetical protein
LLLAVVAVVEKVMVAEVAVAALGPVLLQDLYP